VLGAGNCNDFDLCALASQFTEIHLADLDREALEFGVRRASRPAPSSVILHAPCDLAADRVDLGGAFDIVISAGLLTQLLLDAADPPAVRRRHLQLLFDLVRPGGAFVLVTDVVSSASAPAIRERAERDLPDLLARLIEERNFFTGANPAAIWKQLTEDPEFTARCARIESHDPWLWPVTSSHDYLTWAVTVFKA